jgi:ferredoxin
MNQNVKGVNVESAEVNQDKCAKLGVCWPFGDGFTTDANGNTIFNREAAETDNVGADEVLNATRWCPTHAITARDEKGNVINPEDYDF